MATMAVPYGTDRDMWMQVTTTVVETREASTELQEVRTNLVDMFHMARETFGLRRDFSKIAERQGKLITSLRACHVERWQMEQCNKMCVALDELVATEKLMLKKARSIGPFFAACWATPLAALDKQVLDLAQLAHVFDVYAAPDEVLPGDEGMRAFAASLGDVEDYGYATDHEKVTERGYARI